MKKRILSAILSIVMILSLVTPLSVFADTPTNTFNGTVIPFSDWADCGIGTWKEEDGVLKPASITEYNMLRFSTALGQNYVVDMDVRQLDTTSGWQTIQLGFDVNPGENFTQSGLVLDLHNAGVARVITYADKDKADDTLGSYNNPYGGNGAYVGTSDWFHVTIAREGSNYTVQVGETVLTFTTDAFNGGYLVLGSVGSREVNYKNVKIETVEEAPTNTYNGEVIPFSDWAECGIGTWKEEDGVLKPASITEYNMLRFGTALGQNYTVEMEVRQLDTTSGWQTIQLGFDVNAGENFTQSGLVLDLHNAGVARVITYADKDKADTTLGSYNNPYGGNGAYVGTTDWFRVVITREGSNYTIDVKGTKLTFTTDAFNGGYLVLGSVGSREVNYRNVKITTAEEAPSNTYNGEVIPYSNWSECGIGTWTEEGSILKPTAISDFSMLRFDTALGQEYTIDMDVKQMDNTSGWNTIQIGFDVNPGENFTQSGLVLDMHNAGVARVITYANKDNAGGPLGSYNNPYGGNGAYVGTTDWFHVQIARSGNDYTVKVKNTTLTFTTGDFNGGYLVLGSVGSREVRYKNVKITAVEEAPSNTFNEEVIPFSDWSECGIGSWTEEDSVLRPTELSDFSMLRFDTALGKNYTIDMDVKQLDTTSGWLTIQLGFDVNAGENFTQSGLVLDLHNAGVARVITYADKDKPDATLGSYNNPYGGNGAYVGSTDWFHITITRADNDYTVKVKGTTLSFTTDAFNGGYLVLGSVGSREVRYKNVIITAEVLSPEYELSAWDWTDYTAATATFVDKNGIGGPITVDADITSERTEPTCEENGKIVHTASVIFEDTTYTDTKTEILLAIDHDYELSGWTWTGYTAATATFICANDASHVQTVNATINSVRTEPTAEANGSVVYTASVTFEDVTYTDSKTEILPALGHDYVLSGWDWTNYTAAAATFTDNNGGDPITVIADITSERTEPTCEEAGKIVYTATVVFDGTTYTDVRTEPLGALGHHWYEPTYTWAEDNGTVTATRICERDESHVETETVNTTGEITKPATCTAKGETTYTAIFTNPAFTTQTKTVEDVELADHTPGAPVRENETAPTCTEPGGYDSVVYCAVCGTELSREHSNLEATGHDWNEPVYVWMDDCSRITAMRICKKDASHVENEVGVITSEVTKEATYEEEGEITYTATFTNPAFQTQTKKVATPKIVKPVLDNPFKDVKEGEFYYDAVLWAVNAEPQVTSGTSATTFSPNDTCTRAQVVTFLWRAKGCPEPKSASNPFKDVKAGEYYYKAVLWAVENNITAGTSATTFSPNDGCTRAQVVTFLWRTEGQPKPTSTSNPFKDVPAGQYFTTAVLWAVEKNITKGTGATTFSPNDTCTRGQIVTFLYRDLA